MLLNYPTQPVNHKGDHGYTNLKATIDYWNRKNIYDGWLVLIYPQSNLKCKTLNTQVSLSVINRYNAT